MSLLLITVLSLTLSQIFLLSIVLVVATFILSKIYNVPFLVLLGIFLVIILLFNLNTLVILLILFAIYKSLTK